MNRPFRIVVLISGNGSNLQALIDTQKDHGFILSGVISNRDDAYGLKRASQAGIDSTVIDDRNYPSRNDFESALSNAIEQMQADLVVMAGFMRILTGDFTRLYENRLINIHPSLLPKYKGLHTYRRVMDAGDKFHGATVHFVNSELDGGAIIASASTPVFPDDNELSLKHRTQLLEHRMYPIIVGWFANKRIFCQDGHVWLDNIKLESKGYTFAIS